MWKNVLLLLAAILYGASPYDAIPDLLPGWGWLDDLVVLWFLWKLYQRFNQNRAQPRHSNQQSEQGPHKANPFDRKKAAGTPYEILGISPDASMEEIKQAYRRLANQYHPDKVGHLGDEFKILAEKRFKEIQEAYRVLTKERT